MIKTNISYSTLLVNNTELPYQIRFSKKARYLRIQISNQNELELIIPKRCKFSEAESFLISKSDWIEKHLHVPESKREQFLFLGKNISVRQDFNLFLKKHTIRFFNNELKISSPSGSLLNSIKIFDIWLKQQAKIYLINRTNELSDKYHFQINKVSIRGQKTRWGSCSGNRNLSFNFKLMQFKKEIIDYVILHELCHLKEMNHSKKFWANVEKYCHDYKLLRKELKGGADI
jgi:predicted metal-dependent hydrolase